MISVPVVLDFDSERIIGTLDIDETQLPPTPNYTFSLGYRVENMNDNADITKYTLVCVSPVLDINYIKGIQ